MNILVQDACVANPHLLQPQGCLTLSMAAA